MKLSRGTLVILLLPLFLYTVLRLLSIEGKHQSDPSVCGGSVIRKDTVTKPQEELKTQSEERHADPLLAQIVVNTTANPPSIFFCGSVSVANDHNYKVVLRNVLNEYSLVDIENILKQNRSYSPKNPYPSNSYDIFAGHWYSPCSEKVKVERWLHANFRGKILYLNAEPPVEPVPQLHVDTAYSLGPGQFELQNQHIGFSYLQASFWGHVSHDMNRFFDPSQRPRGTKEHFLIYASSHCFITRDGAFLQIAALRLAPTYYAGKCPKKNHTHATYYPNDIGLKTWQDNVHLFSKFRFCLVMEHAYAPYYITEKIMLAFWAGCIPIYYGDAEHIYEFFDKDAFVYMDVENPQPALDQIAELERNATAYQAMMERPILANGNATIERFFSLNETIGGGDLRRRIRSMLQLDRYKFVS